MEKPIPDFPEYLASSLGYVISLKGGKRKALVGGSCNGGYCGVLLRRNGKTIRRNVHRLIAAAFLDLPDGVGEINHIDGNKLNNALENIEVTSHSENMKHAVRIGIWTTPTDAHKELMKRRVGEVKSLFTLEEASDILEMKATLGLTCREVAKIVGCSKTPIQRLANGSMKYFRNGSIVV
jgi:hypothetical protein